MSVSWPFADDYLRLGGVDKLRIDHADAERQTLTAREILRGLQDQPGVLLGDEVGMGKTYVALAVAASVIVATKGKEGPVVVMTPPGLHEKWQREWRQFKRHCAAKSLDWVRDAYARSPTDFFKLLDDSKPNHLVFLTTGCFSSGLADPWIKLAMIRCAGAEPGSPRNRKTASTAGVWIRARMASNRNLNEDLVRRLMAKDVGDWKRVLVASMELSAEDDDPVPELLSQCEDRIDWSELATFIRTELPKRHSSLIEERIKRARGRFNGHCRAIYKQWLELSKWRSPLLILDEGIMQRTTKLSWPVYFVPAARRMSRCCAASSNGWFS